MHISVDTKDITMDDIVLFFAILMGMCLTLWCILQMIRKRQESRVRSAPVEQGNARVIDVQNTTTNGTISVTRIWVTFELENGRRVRLQDKNGNNLVTGDEGFLHWQADQIYSFQRGKKMEQIFQRESTFGSAKPHDCGGGWTCTNCGHQNEALDISCKMCGEYR